MVGDDNAIQNLQSERAVFEILKGEFVVKAICSFMQDNYVFFVLDYMIGGDF